MKIKKLITAQDSENLSRYFSEIRDFQSLTQEEETVLIIDIQKNKSQKSLTKLINANLKFVISVAKHYQGQGTPILDLISQGNLGLLIAVDRFEVARGYKFFSYAVWWIRIRILTSLDLHKRIVQLPANRELLVQRIKKEIVELENKLNRLPTSEEIQAILKKKYKKEKKGNPPSIRDIEEAVAFGGVVKSLQDKVGPGEDDDTLEDQLAGDFDTDHDILVDSMLKDLDRFLAQLTQVQCDILKLMLGLGGEPKHSPEDTAEALGITLKEVTKLKSQAIPRLRKVKNIEKLQDYL